uniref:Small ribosomal subunit protein eS21 n=1 Tax=Fundulus heteroclitus TaxID=8078 RepID=A0A3Q2QSE0_FUNHE
MQNDAGEFVDLYVPRKCSASNRIIGAKDHASIQINIAEVDKVTGRFNGQTKTYAICGAIRRMGESDDSILRLAKTDGVVAKYERVVRLSCKPLILLQSESSHKDTQWGSFRTSTVESEKNKSCTQTLDERESNWLKQ